MTNDPQFDTAQLEADATPSAFPLNRVVVVLAPVIATGAGALASWLLVHVHFLGLFNLTRDALSTGIAQLVTFGITALLTYAAHHKWLDGWQSWERGLQEIEKAKAQADNVVPFDPPNVDGPPPADRPDSGARTQT